MRRTLACPRRAGLAKRAMRRPSCAVRRAASSTGIFVRGANGPLLPGALVRWRGLGWLSRPVRVGICTLVSYTPLAASILGLGKNAVLDIAGLV